MAPDATVDLGGLLADAAGLSSRELVAFVGGGGKTTLLLALARTLRTRGSRVLLTTTTKVGADQMSGEPGFRSARRVGDKLVGPPPGDVDAWFMSGEQDVVLVEADGSQHRPVKAPAPHEPVIPSASTTVVAVIGADALHRVVQDVAHRPMRVAAVAGCSPYERLTPARAARLLSSDRGGRRGVPEAARFLVAVNRVGPAEQVAAGELARQLRDAGVTTVLVPWYDQRG
jgi:molybdenum cofactor cytidylyltransferase